VNGKYKPFGNPAAASLRGCWSDGRTPMGKRPQLNGIKNVDNIDIFHSVSYIIISAHESSMNSSVLCVPRVRSTILER